MKMTFKRDTYFICKIHFLKKTLDPTFSQAEGKRFSQIFK